MRRRTVKLTVCLLFTLCVLTGLSLIARAAEPYIGQEILFSESESFSTEDIYLELSTFMPSDIYYTLDGSEPTDEDLLYDGPLFLEAADDTACYPVKAVAYYSDGTVSDVYTKTYFVGGGTDGRFSTTVVSITGDPDGLFGYENGILVTGVIRDYYVMDNPGTEISDSDPANFNVRGDEAERAVYVEVWDADGDELLGQQLGLRVYGGLSRSSDQKSLKLIARDEYGSNQIEYEFFQDEDEILEKLQSVADESDLEPDLDKRIVLRNHGNDQEAGYVRNELAQALSSDAGYPFTQQFTAASVWINGEYYGFMWLEEVYDENYLESYYDTDSDEGEFVIVEAYSLEDGEEDGDSQEGGAGQDDADGQEGEDSGYGFEDYKKELSEEEQEAEEAAAALESEAKEDLAGVLDYASLDLTDDEIFEELTELIDIDNFLSYCAIEIYLANCDWPSNNIKAFRWYSDDGEYGEEEGTDGKWRFLFYDLDMGMARTADSSYTSSTLAYVLGAAVEESTAWDMEFPLLKAVLQREDMRERFIQIMEEYMEGAFSYEHVCEVLESLEEDMAGELDRQIWAYAAVDAEKKGGEAEDYYEAAVVVHEEEIEAIKDFFRNRADVMREELDNLEEYLK